MGKPGLGTEHWECELETRASPPPFGVLGGEAGYSNTLEHTHLEDKRLALVDGRVELGLGTCEPSCVVHRQLVTRLGKRLAVASPRHILRHAHDDEASSRESRLGSGRALPAAEQSAVLAKTSLLPRE